MKTLRFEGYSDDTFGEYAVFRDDYDNCAQSKAITFRVDAGGEALYVVGFYAPKGTLPACWVIGVQRVDEGAPVPAWPMRIAASKATPYTHALEIDVPDDVKLTHVDEKVRL